ncbi:hypothetical protein NDU88_001516 [Pleurodeles waltl]|uniref:Uncharacterized protein n=1 Tax=Pleurodeles waltl TaxID=8319 RepID=A0AAV7WMI7_PLEWA|nr:hypothetical protein NDU88_001516 [Pleurodeles waltl]
MMEAMHSFMASAKALAGLDMDEQGASSRRAGAGRDTNSPPTMQGEASALGAEVADRVAPDTPAGGSEKATVVRPDPPLLSSELVAKAKSDTSYRALRWDDLKMGQDMVELRVRRYKTDQKGKGVVVRLRGLGDPK